MASSVSSALTTLASFVPSDETILAVGEMAKSATSLAILGAVSSLAGAWVGAWAAQRIAERNKKRDEIRAELRHVNVAIAVAHAICNTGLTFKKQHAAPKMAALNELHERVLQLRPGATLEANLDMQHLAPPHFVVEVLQEHLFKHLSLVGPPLILFAFLRGAIGDLAAMVEARNEQIKTIESSDWNPKQRVHRYVGLPVDDTVDRRMADAVRGIYRTCDDVIFMSNAIATDLEAHQAKLVAEIKKNFSDLQTPTTEVDFEESRREGLFPDPSEYAELMRRLKGKAADGDDPKGRKARPWWWRWVGSYRFHR